MSISKQKTERDCPNNNTSLAYITKKALQGKLKNATILTDTKLGNRSTRKRKRKKMKQPMVRKLQYSQMLKI